MKYPAVITASTATAVSLDYAKAHARIDFDDDEVLIEGWIRAAEQLIEQYCGIRLMTQTIELQLDGFPYCNWFYLNATPVQSIVSFTYDDTDDAEQSYTDYQADLTSDWPRIRTVNDAWPNTRRNKLNSVRVRMVAGYASASAVPQTIKQAVCMTVKIWDEYRDGMVPAGQVGRELPVGVQSLLRRHRAG